VDRGAVRVGDIKVPRRVESQTGPGQRDRCADVTGGVYLADSANIGNEDVARLVHCDGGGKRDLGAGCRATVPGCRVSDPGVIRSSIPGKGADFSGRIHLADDIVAIVRDVDVARAVDGHVGRKLEPGIDCRAAIAEVAYGSVAGDGTDHRLAVTEGRSRQQREKQSRKSVHGWPVYWCTERMVPVGDSTPPMLA